MIANDLINSNTLANSNSLFQTSSANDNLLTSNSSGTATIQLIPVQLTQQWIQNNINSTHQQNDETINSNNNNGTMNI